jgi:hypothetical protein
VMRKKRKLKNFFVEMDSERQHFFKSKAPPSLRYSALEHKDFNSIYKSRRDFGAFLINNSGAIYVPFV